jgi:ATP-dependent DNA helicase DinG
VTSTRDNCLGTRCADFANCHVVAARREAQAADLVIVNHHLWLADLSLKEDGFGDLLGSADAVILDEAHQLPDLATQFFGVQVGSRQIENVLIEGRASLLRSGGSLAEIGTAARAVEAAIGAVLTTLASKADLESATLALVSALRDYASRLADAAREAAVEQVAKRAVELAASLERIALCTDDEGARTSETNGRSFSLGLLPFDISERFKSLIEARPAAWVFTSATLSVASSSQGDDFSHFASRLGLGDAEALRIPSPFDYEAQAMLYLPAGMPEPTAPGYVEAVIEACIPLLDASGGGAFLLFTSHRALAQGAAALRARWDGAAETPILVQGEGPREKLLRDFREHGNAVLLGTASFWEGVDVKGEALRLVVIEKLPFASPDDPLTKARIAHLQRKGENAFRDYQLPEAVLALKQGVGRLIRSETDRGMIVIADPRLLTKGYGRTFRASLPPMPVTQDRDEALRFLRKLR